MSDGRQRRKAKQARRDARRRAARERELTEDVPLINEVREALDSGHPRDLLSLVSFVIEATAPKPWTLPGDADAEASTLEDLLGSFIEVKIPETTALLAVAGELVDDDVLRLRCHAEVALRNDSLPEWISEIGQTKVVRVVRMTHVLGDGDELIVDVTLPGGHPMTGAVFIDHHMLSEVGDAFFVDASIDAVLNVAHRAEADPDTSFIELSLADARAWIEHGIEVGEMVPASESDTWPASRPLLKWLIRALPEGGVGYQPPTYEPTEIEEVQRRFLASDAGAPFDDYDHREILETCINEGTGDPLRWSSARIAELLGSRFPLFDQLTPIEARLDLPDLLRAYVPFAHAQSGIRDELTAEALTSIDQHADDYREAILVEDEEDLDGEGRSRID